MDIVIKICVLVVVKKIFSWFEILFFEKILLYLQYEVTFQSTLENRKKLQNKLQQDD